MHGNGLHPNQVNHFQQSAKRQNLLPSGWGGRHNAASQDDRDLQILPIPANRDDNRVAGIVAFNIAEEIVHGRNFFAIQTDNQIGCFAINPLDNERSTSIAKDCRPFDSRLFSRATRNQLGDKQPVFGFIHAGNSNLGANDSTMPNQLRHDPFDQADGNRETDSGTLTGRRINGGVNADHPAVGIEHRPPEFPG